MFFIVTVSISLTCKLFSHPHHKGSDTPQWGSDLKLFFSSLSLFLPLSHSQSFSLPSPLFSDVFPLILRPTQTTLRLNRPSSHPGCSVFSPFSCQIHFRASSWLLFPLDHLHLLPVTLCVHYSYRTLQFPFPIFTVTLNSVFICVITCLMLFFYTGSQAPWWQNCLFSPCCIS